MAEVVGRQRVNRHTERNLRVRLNHVMVDKVQAKRRDRIKSVIGSASLAEMRAVDVAIRAWMSLD